MKIFECNKHILTKEFYLLQILQLLYIKINCFKKSFAVPRAKPDKNIKRYVLYMLNRKHCCIIEIIKSIRYNVAAFMMMTILYITWVYFVWFGLRWREEIASCQTYIRFWCQNVMWMYKAAPYIFHYK